MTINKDYKMLAKKAAIAAEVYHEYYQGKFKNQAQAELAFRDRWGKQISWLSIKKAATTPVSEL